MQHGIQSVGKPVCKKKKKKKAWLELNFPDFQSTPLSLVHHPCMLALPLLNTIQRSEWPPTHCPLSLSFHHTPLGKKEEMIFLPPIAHSEMVSPTANLSDPGQRLICGQIHHGPEQPPLSKSLCKLRERDRMRMEGGNSPHPSLSHLMIFITLTSLYHPFSFFFLCFTVSHSTASSFLHLLLPPCSLISNLLCLHFYPYTSWSLLSLSLHLALTLCFWPWSHMLLQAVFDTFTGNRWDTPESKLQSSYPIQNVCQKMYTVRDRERKVCSVR